jgi:TrpR family trp operon transcriptional repressor
MPLALAQVSLTWRLLVWFNVSMHRNKLDQLGELTSLLLHSQDTGLAERFLRELLTPAEVEGISFRWELVKRLDQGQTQRAIAAELGLSLCKITRGSRILKNPDSALRAFLDRQRRAQGQVSPLPA